MLQADQARVKECLLYDESTGLFTWKKQLNGRVKAGTIAGSLTNLGYLDIHLDRQGFKAHRLAWLYVHGEMPPAEIDHINGIKTDNRIANLRPATRAENMRNSRPRKSASGLKGASWRARRKTWVGQIMKDGKRLSLGEFATAEEAHTAYVKAAQELFGEFARVA